VDLDGFEPSTSSMPFKKYQSLPDTSRKNKGLTAADLDATETHSRIWTLHGLQSPDSLVPTISGPLMVAGGRIEAAQGAGIAL